MDREKNNNLISLLTCLYTKVKEKKETKGITASKRDELLNDCWEQAKLIAKELELPRSEYITIYQWVDASYEVCGNLDKIVEAFGVLYKEIIKDKVQNARPI